MKKQLLVIGMFLMPFTIFAQNYRHIADSLFFNLNKTGAATGMLYDRVYPLAGLHEFNKVQPDTSSSKHFKQSYFEMFNAAFNNSSWLPPEYIGNIALGAHLDTLVKKVAVGLGYYEFNVIDTNAIANNLIYMGVDSLFYDVNPRSGNPFKTITNLVASPLLDSIQGLTVNYVFDNRLYFNKGILSISSLQVDFNNGNGLINVAIGSSYNITYPSAGYKVLKFVATMSNSSVITTYGVILVTEPTEELYARGCTNADGPVKKIESDLSFQGYDENSSSKGQGEYQIFYATNGNCDNVLRKPIIIVDGFDPGDKRSIGELYSEYLNNESNGLFADNLRAAGYDVVILNFPNYEIGSFSFLGMQIPIMRDGGADYIERNARVLMTLINTLNAQKSGTEKNVIIGPSMGGLISRYALKHMEGNSQAHQTRLWISFDSPHQGANIPIGDQYFLDFYAAVSESAKENRDKKISSVAAKQMLVYHYLSGSNTPAGAPTFRSTFETTMNNLGFPNGDSGQPFRKISLIDGNLSGIRDYTGGQQAFSFDLRHSFSIKLFLFKIKINIATVTLSSARAHFVPDYGASATIFRGWFVSSLLARSEGTTTPSATVGLDTAPGGTYNTQQILKDEGDGVIGGYNAHTVLGKVLNIITLGAFNVRAKFYSVIPTHSFINTKSALAFTGTNQNLSENLSGRSLVCTGETPFDSYFGDFTINRGHVDLWPEAVEFVREEINGNPQLPLIKNNTLSISGPFQSGSNTTYSVANVPAGATIKWEVTAPYTINGVNTANPVGVVIPSNNSQFAELVATISTNCYQTKVRKNLVPPTITTALSGGNGDSCGLGTASINVPSGANFVWTSEGDVSIEGLPPGQPYHTTSNSVNIVGISGSITVQFQSYGNTVTVMETYEPYRRNLHISGYLPLLPSDPLIVTVQDVDFNVETYNWYINNVLVQSNSSDTYSTWDKYYVNCDYNDIRLEAVLSCGTSTVIAETQFEQLCGGGWWRTMVVYPNPASSYLSIRPDIEKQKALSTKDKSNMKEYEAILYDVKGKLLLKGRSSNQRLQLDTKKLKSDYYYLHIRADGEKEIIKQQVIIRN
ncbi:T9SS type A sorting domain-containing protein [Pedobacter sp.]